MLEDFLNNKLYIAIRPEDTYLLPTLQKTLGELKWATGDYIDSNLTKRYVEQYEHVFLHSDNGKVYFKYRYITLNENNKIVTLPEFLFVNEPEIRLEENELLEMLKGE